jgi:hypothetical protein
MKINTEKVLTLKTKAGPKRVCTLFAAALCAVFLALSCASLGGDIVWEDDPEYTPPGTAVSGGGGRAASDRPKDAVRLASGVYEVSENFERFAEGAAIAPGVLAGSSFTAASNPSGGGSGEIIVVTDGGSKALKMTHTGPVTGGRTSLLYRPGQDLVDAVGLEKKVELEFRFKVEGTNGTVSLPYVFYASAPSNAGLTANYNAGNERFAGWDGGRQVATDTFAKGEWHTFKAVLDYSVSAFDLFVDGVEYLSGAAFRQNAGNDPGAPKNFGVIQFYLANVADGGSITVYLDDIKITAGL